jgi:hypothetical protein
MPEYSLPNETIVPPRKPHDSPVGPSGQKERRYNVQIAMALHALLLLFTVTGTPKRISLEKDETEQQRFYVVYAGERSARALSDGRCQHIECPDSWLAG